LLIDSHAHIDLAEFNKDRDQVLERARQQGVRVVINAGLDAESSRKSLEMAKKYDDVFVTVGFHPHEASKMKEGDLKSLADLTKDSRVVAIGEIGLDFYRNLSPRQSQLEAFQKQLDLAVELGLPVVVHCRQAHKEVYDILSLVFISRWPVR
jgi:TatD DNase family protein